MQFLNSPWITGLLLVLGLIGLYLEFSSPGIGFGGLLAAVCFAIFFWSHFFGNPAAWLAVVLFLLGIAFVAVELFILPGFAVAGLAGAILIIASVVLAIQGFFVPKSPQDLGHAHADGAGDFPLRADVRGGGGDYQQAVRVVAAV